jgi:hypothetical protein
MEIERENETCQVSLPKGLFTSMSHEVGGEGRRGEFSALAVGFFLAVAFFAEFG